MRGANPPSPTDADGGAIKVMYVFNSTNVSFNFLSISSRIFPRVQADAGVASQVLGVELGLRDCATIMDHVGVQEINLLANSYHLFIVFLQSLLSFSLRLVLACDSQVTLFQLLVCRSCRKGTLGNSQSQRTFDISRKHLSSNTRVPYPYLRSLAGNTEQRRLFL